MQVEWGLPRSRGALHLNRAVQHHIVERKAQYLVLLASELVKFCTVIAKERWTLARGGRIQLLQLQFVLDRYGQRIRVQPRIALQPTAGPDH